MPKKNLISDLLRGVNVKDPYTNPVSISLNGKQKIRWNDLVQRVKDATNGKVTLADYARPSLDRMMDDVEVELAKLGKPHRR